MVAPIAHADSPIDIVADLQRQVADQQKQINDLRKLVVDSHHPRILTLETAYQEVKFELAEVRKDVSATRLELGSIGASVRRIENWATKDRLSQDAIVSMLAKIDRRLDPNSTPPV